MASIKDLKNRIGTVKNTQQTTRAMKMVSAAKLRRAQEAIQNQRPYAQQVGALIRQLSALTNAPIQSPLMRREESSEGMGKKKVMLVLLSSDRGLCGGFNSSIIKAAQRWVAAHKDEYETIELAFVGKKAYDYFKNRNVVLGPYYQELGGKVTYAKAKKLSEALIESYTSGRVDEVKVIFNEFKNAVTQVVRVDDYLPLRNTATEAQAATPTGTPDAIAPDYIVRPSVQQVLSELMAKNFQIQAFRYLLESQASEHGARMSAMENATKNAGEMIRGLTLQYNKQRQAGITKELLEIIAGSESQKAS